MHTCRMYIQMQHDVMCVSRADGIQGLKHFPGFGCGDVFKAAKADALLIDITLAHRHTFKVAAHLLPTGSLFIICDIC